MDAKRVCDYLGIPHYTLNFKDGFKKYVIDDFINCYANCRTPNPCIECNNTIGQCKGLGISNKTPLYVIGFNKEKNELIVGEEKELYKKDFVVQDVDWLVFNKLDKEMIVDVKTRYSSKEYKTKIIPNETNVKVIFEEPRKSITVGQSAVIYINDKKIKLLQIY